MSMTPLSVVAASAAHEGLRLGLVAAAFGFGFRHGIDWDHIAALTDISSSQDSRRRSMAYCTLYALGHALVVFVPDGGDGRTFAELELHEKQVISHRGRAFRALAERLRAVSD